jgi:hypothetical protein
MKKEKGQALVGPPDPFRYPACRLVILSTNAAQNYLGSQEKVKSISGNIPTITQHTVDARFIGRHNAETICYALSFSK